MRTFLPSIDNLRRTWKRKSRDKGTILFGRIHVGPTEVPKDEQEA